MEELVKRRPRKTDERKKMLTEMGALAYVQMLHGDYRYPPGVRRGNVVDGVHAPNLAEVMRRAGYTGDSVEHFDRLLKDNEYFQQCVNLFELRYTDPNFSEDREDSLFKVVGNEALRALYERVMYTPHSLTTDQHIKIVKLVLDAGITFHKLQKEENKSEKLLKTITDPEKKNRLLKDYKAKLLRELDEVERASV